MVRLKISEHTNRTELINSLKTQLGIKYRVFQELISDKIQEDIIIFKRDLIQVDLGNNEISFTDKNAIIAIIETKNRGGKINRSEDQLLKYLKKLNCRIGFLSNFEDLICYNYNSDWTIDDSNKKLYRNSDLDKHTREIINFIEKSKHIKIVIDPEEFISFLEEAIESLTEFTMKIDPILWAKMLKFSDFPEQEEKEKEFGSKEKEERRKFYQRSAAYIGIAQILFYITFRQYRLDENINISPELPPLSISNGIPNQVQILFDKIPNNNLNFKTIFGHNRQIFNKIDDAAADTIIEIIVHLEGLSVEYVIKNDLIGQIFQRLMPYETRKKYAAYYTTRKAAQLLCSLSINDKTNVIMDPACGSGTLLVYSYHYLKKLGNNQHERLISQIYGSDLSDVASMMSTLNLAIQDPKKWINHINIYPHDILDLIGPGLDRFFPITKMGADSSSTNTAEKLPDFDVVVGNPPFTRCMRLSVGYRKRLLHLPLILKHKFKPNFKALGLYSFFLLIVPSLIKKKKKGRISFILPLGAINSDSMIEVWKILFKENLGLKYLIFASMEDSAFSDSSGTEIIVFLEKNYKEKAKLIQLKGKLNETNISALKDKIIAIKDPKGILNEFDYVIWDQSKICNNDCIHWSVELSVFIPLFYSKYVSFKHFKKQITIISQNQSRPADYWFIPNKYWEIHEDKPKHIIIRPTTENKVITESKNPNQKIKLPKVGLVKALERSIGLYSNYPPIIPKNVSTNFFIVDENHEDFQEYKKWGKKSHNTKLFGSESHSRSTVALNQLGILQKFSFTGSKTISLRFEEPLMGAGVIMFGFYSKNEDLIDLLFSYLSSSLFLLDTLYKARIRAKGLSRIHKTDIEKRFKFPNLIEIYKNEKLKNKLIRISIEYNSETSIEDRPFFPEKIDIARNDKNDVLRQLDEAWFEALDIPKESIDNFYKDIKDKLNEFSNSN